MPEKIIAIRKKREKGNVFFILSNYEELTLKEAISLAKKGEIADVSVVKSQSGSYLRGLPNDTADDNLSTFALSCNPRDFLIFDGSTMYLVTGNGRVKRSWEAFSGSPKAGPRDQKTDNYGPLPEGKYYARFDKTMDFYSERNLWEKAKWLVKTPSWGLVATPLEADKNTDTFGRGHFYIHGGWRKGTLGCIELNQSNEAFHLVARLYGRNLTLFVKYD